MIDYGLVKLYHPDFNNPGFILSPMIYNDHIMYLKIIDDTVPVSIIDDDFVEYHSQRLDLSIMEVIYRDSDNEDWSYIYGYLSKDNVTDKDRLILDSLGTYSMDELYNNRSKKQYKDKSNTIRYHKKIGLNDGIIR